MFSEKLKSLRSEHSLSQDKLANTLNNKYETSISKSMISRWENGSTDPQMKYVRIIANFFEIEPNELVGVPSSETSSPDMLTIYRKLDTDHQSKVYDFAREQLADQQHAAEDQSSTYAIDDPALASEQDNFKSTSD